MQLLDKAELTSEIKSAADYSYSAGDYAGPGYRIVGDAGGAYNRQDADTDLSDDEKAFIDPLFSTGVHLAFNGGLCAASTIAASIRGDCTEEKAVEFHNTKMEISYTRYEDSNFLITILAVYKQIKAQKENILNDMDEDNFDRIFRLLSPGAVDIDPRLSPREIEETLAFFERIVWPTRPQATDGVSEGTKKILHAINGQSHLCNDVIGGYHTNI
ncbi:hypothetical protein C0993_010123, partial [Termitomyces sp. T159_Od127]